jgi:hypothetical protein
MKKGNVLGNHNSGEASDDRGWKWAKRIIFPLLLIGGFLAAAWPQANKPLKGAAWTILLFAALVASLTKFVRQVWFWKALLVAGCMHAFVLWLLLDYFANKPFLLLFIPVVVEYIPLFLLFLRFDPQRGADL